MASQNDPTPLLVVLLDGSPELEYDRNTPLPPQQALYLDKMDEKMDQGIEIGEEFIPEPDAGAKAKFVAANLATAMLQDNDAMIAAMCSYLATRQRDLKQVQIQQGEQGLEIELDYENVYSKPVQVEFKSLH